MTFLALAGTVALGWSIARIFARGLTRAELAGWSVATGLLAQAVLYLVCISVAPGTGPAPLLALNILLGAIALVIAPSGALVSAGRLTLIGRALLALAAGCALVFLVIAISEPMWTTDYLAIWGLKARTIFETGALPARLFDDPALAWSHPEYPLLVPLALAAIATLAGGWHDPALALVYSLCMAATLLAIYGFVARRVGPLPGATAAALAGGCFALYRAVNVGTAEIPLALGLVLISTAFLDSLEQSAFARVAVAALICSTLKPEGTLYVLLLAAAFAVVRRSFPRAFVYPAALHGLFLIALRGPIDSRDFDERLFSPQRWGELASRIGVAAGRIAEFVPVTGRVTVAAIVIYLLVTRRGVADPLLAVLALQLGAYVVACAASAFGPTYAVDSAFLRIATTLYPALVLVLAARLPMRDAA